jgi:hypothetical protein
MRLCHPVLAQYSESSIGGVDFGRVEYMQPMACEVGKEYPSVPDNDGGLPIGRCSGVDNPLGQSLFVLEALGRGWK